MGTTPLRQFLWSLCHNSCWNYAVFWKLQQQNEMFLTWEDGCYDHLKLRAAMESILDDICFDGSNEIVSSSWRSSRHDGHSGEYPIGQVVADMESVQYPWGEGVVGEVAYTGKHCWVLFDNVAAGEFTSKVVHECPDEWLPQLAAGIKTILLVPVVPCGVLQLGSLEKVAEYPALVAYVREKFNAYQNAMDILPFISREFVAQTSLSLVPVDMNNLDESSATALKKIKSENPKAVYNVKPTNNILSTTNQMTRVCLVQDARHISRKEVVDNLNSTRENKISVQSMGLIEVSQPLNQSLNDTESEMIEGSVVEVSGLDKELQFSYSDNYNVGLFGQNSNVVINSYPNEHMMEQPFVDKDPDNGGHENVNSFFNFPMDNELHDALGPAFLGQAKEYLWDSSLSGEDACSSLNKTFKKDLNHGIEPSTWESSGLFANRDEAHRLNAVVASMHGGLNDNLSTKPNDVKLSITSMGQFAASNKSQSQPEETAFVEGKRVPWGSVTSASGAGCQNAITESPPSSSFDNMISALTEQKQKKKANGYLQTRKGSKLSNDHKRRARPGEKQRSRPRDRQLILDRVKELRQLVPYSSKCSIDGLLDRTIKHMLFLRSVTDQADKLRQCVHQEVIGRKNMKTSGIKGDSKNGKSWAFELGSDLQVCPIVVEDLEYPGHMLIEMLCNDHGLFMEIAEVICRLELTILKGMMESRSNNTWAHFIVEASRGFHRLDIFWPLMQLLQHNQCPISCKI
ncbi:unnamed protein product [Camellia sinensis]